MRTLKGEDGSTIIVNEYPKDPIIWQKCVSLTDGYLSIFGTFDIETTNFKILDSTHAVMYIWQVCIGDPHGKQRDVYVGRRWSDFRSFLAEIAKHYKLCSKRQFLFYIHNSGFEFQFMRSVFNITDMFAVKKRVPLKFDVDYGFTFRCSYKLSNMALGKFCEEELAQHGKLKGFNYLKKRYPDTKLTNRELLYCVDDVLGLHESVSHLMLANGDTLSTIPNTSTGYIRRDAREHVLENPKNYFHLRDNQLTVNQYVLCKSAGRGGNTHTNPLYSGQLIGVDEVGAPTVMWGYDIKSSYPYEMVSNPYYPMGKFTPERCKYFVKDAANIVHIILYDVKLKSGVYFPYIAKSKCEDLPRKYGSEYLFDNGRVLRAPWLRMCITSIDWEIIKRQYDFSDNYTIIEQYVADYGYLCKEYRDYVWELFKTKCKLETGDPYFYAKFKNKINGCFGMIMTDITREDIIYNNNEWGSDCPPLVTSLAKYYSNRKSFLEYQHGLFVTANARASLQQGLDAVGIDGVYCDTDSVKALGNHDEKFNALNVDRLKQLENAGYGIITIGDKSYTLGMWETDTAYSAFISHGAKKYAYRYSNDPVNKPKKRDTIGVTVAGLSKDLGAAYLEKNGGLSAFNVGEWDNHKRTKGTLFDEFNSGRLKATYNDDIVYKEVTINGHLCELTSNVALLPTRYELGITEEYAALLEMRDVVFD